MTPSFADDVVGVLNVSAGTNGVVEVEMPFAPLSADSGPSGYLSGAFLGDGGDESDRLVRFDAATGSSTNAVWYNKLYAIVLAHEEGHISIMESYRAKLNKEFEEEDSSCYEDLVFNFDELESNIQDEAEAYFDKVLKEWHDANNKYQKEEETNGRHKEFERIKSEYNKKQGK